MRYVYGCEGSVLRWKQDLSLHRASSQPGSPHSSHAPIQINSRFAGDSASLREKGWFVCLENVGATFRPQDNLSLATTARAITPNPEGRNRMSEAYEV